MDLHKIAFEHRAARKPLRKIQAVGHVEYQWRNALSCSVPIRASVCSVYHIGREHLISIHVRVQICGTEGSGFSFFFRMWFSVDSD
jgi:hypothetical protein